MAIWYLDYNSANTTANGSFAYPFSPASSIRGSMTNGDELRILGNTMANICNSTIYYVNIIDGLSMNVTSGGNLGADFKAYDLLYFPTYDTFAKIVTVTSGNLNLFSSHTWPVPNTAITNTTVQVVNTAIINSQSTVVHYLGTTAMSNVVVSDAWVSPTTRVTDGTVKSILDLRNPSSQPGIYFDYPQNPSNVNNTFNLQNSIVVGHTNSTFPFSYFYFYGTNNTYNIHSLIGSYYMLNSIGNSAYPFKNSYININHMTTPGGLHGAITIASNVTFNIGNTYTQSTGSGGGAWPINSGLYINQVSDLTYIFGNVYSYTTGTSFISCYLPGPNTNIILNGTMEYRSNLISASYEFLDGIGNTSINFGPSFSMKCNGRNRTINTFNYIVGFALTLAQTGKQILPTITLPAGYTYVATYPYTYTTQLTGGPTWPVWTHPKIPPVFNLEVPGSSLFYTAAIYAASGQNMLITYRDGSSPVEFLWPNGLGYGSSLSYTSIPNVTLDASTYRTTGPSLKSYLPNRQTGIWDDTKRQGRARKIIKIPVTGGQANTITGYIRTDTPNTLFANADVQMYTLFNNSILASNTITNQCCNAWSQFTMTFTPAYSGEATLVWEMYYSTPNKSYWLDDLTIS